MRIKLTRSQAQQHIIDVAHLLTTGADDVVVALPDVWQTEKPTVESCEGWGWYWVSTYPDGAWTIVELEQYDDGKLYAYYFGKSELIEDCPFRYWLPISMPDPPFVDDDDAIPCGAVQVTGAVGTIFDDDED